MRNASNCDNCKSSGATSRAYVKVTVVLMLDAGWEAGQVAQALGLDDGTVYRYVQAWQRLGQAKYLVHKASGY